MQNKTLITNLIPKEIWLVIFNYLNSRSLDNTSASCSHFRNLINNDNLLFKQKGLKAKVCHLPYRFLQSSCTKTKSVIQTIKSITDTLRQINFNDAHLNEFLSLSKLTNFSNFADKISKLSTKGLIILFLVEETLKSNNDEFANCVKKMIDMIVKSMLPEEKTQFQEIVNDLRQGKINHFFTTALIIYYATPLPEDYNNFNMNPKRPCQIL